MATRGIAQLKQRGIAFDPLHYRFEHRTDVARTAADALGLPYDEVVKSLVFRASDGSFLFALLGSDAHVSVRNLGRATGHKHVDAASPRDAQRITGYLIGGISPLGAKTPLPVVLDATTASHRRLAINAGARGTLVRLKTDDLVRVTGAKVADIRT